MQVNSIFLKTVFPSLLGLISGLILGLTEHKWSANWEKKKLVYDQQIKVWQSLSTDFPKYIVSRMKLRDIAEFQSKKIGVPKNEEKSIDQRKERYLTERDSSRSALMADLEQAKLIFPKSTTLIEKYQEFDVSARLLTISQLPPENEWKNYMKSVLQETFAEIEPL